MLALPHPSGIRGWAASVDCEPGYLTNVIKLLGEIVKKKGWMSEVVLMVDAMTLHKGTVWDPNQGVILELLTMEQLFQRMKMNLLLKLWCLWL